ncbi:MAG: hypothetical protein SF069_01045 [Phycisphaerae bacterium]|nr:hypothetical protein [Phycisphaerae bacterium]
MAMRFFTFQWWSGHCEQVDVIAEYEEHFEAVRSHLPPTAAHLHDAESLHDSRVEAFDIDMLANCVILRLTGFSRHDGHERDRRFELRYGGVSRVVFGPSPEQPLGGPGGFGDLGYDEFDLSPEHRFLHRLLFSTGIELEITFRSFEYDARESGA